MEQCLLIMMHDLQMNEIRYVWHGLETLYQQKFPKVDPILLHDLLVREKEKSERAPFYMVEVFTKPGTNSEWCEDSRYLKLPALFQE